MHIIPPITLLIAGMIHLLPLPGIAGSIALRKLYAIQISDPNLEILLRHRAIMFGVLGGLLLAAAFVPPLRAAAFCAGLVSAASFIVIARLVGDYGVAVQRVVLGDIVATAALLLGAAVHVFRSGF